MRPAFVRNIAVVAAFGMATTAAYAQDRDFCPDRPGLGTPACTLDAGRVAIEVSGVDWTVERDPSTRTDTLIAGDILLRVGLTDTMEAQLGWTAFGRVRTRDRISGSVDRQRGTGDLTVALRQNLSNPDGSGFSLAVMPFATVPTGGNAIGAGDWSAGLLIPISYDLSDSLSLALTPSVEAAVNASGKGRHSAYGSVVGLTASLTDAIDATLEVQAVRDRDPSGHNTQALTGLSFAWSPADNMQLDVGAVAGLNNASPDFQLYMGIARRF